MKAITNRDGLSVTEYSFAEFKAAFGSLNLDAINEDLEWQSRQTGGNVSYRVECVGHGYRYIVSW